MVTCESQGTPVGFRLGARDRDDEPRRRAPSVSSSVYKQKIDALFDDSRSVASLPQYPTGFGQLERRDSKVSSSHDNKVTIYEDEDGYCQSNDTKINNTVQDRIERMFADMAGESRLPVDNIGIHVFSVHYLGSTPLQDKVTSLSGLQTPLKKLYFAHRRNFHHKNALTGRLEISKSGLKVRYKGEKGDLEQLNPFPTIAVWSAVKFVVQPSETNENELCYAFLPLITDPDNIDRQALFKTLESPDNKYILSHNEKSHSPLFAVVMRKIGVAKQLECHGFVCQTTEDAIVIAATLYKSLMSHMSRQGHSDNKKLKNRNGVSCMSVGSSMSPNDIVMPNKPPRKKPSTSSMSGDSDKADGFSASESYNEKHRLERTKKISSESLPSPPPPPSITPAECKRITVEEVKAKLDSIKNNDTSGSDTHDSRKSAAKSCPHPAISKLQNHLNSNSGSESSVRTKVSEKIELFKELERRKNLQRPPTLPPPIPSKPSEAPQEPPKEPLRRNQSGRKSLSESGDILTKVAIPRSGSFLNAGGLTRYKSIGHRNNGKKGGGSPLGFNELFNEFKVQENLHSMDEILNAIIDAEGMSFNDLKPIYKEFLLKLAVTLTKDEIFQHSKAIMKKQKKKILRRNSTFQNKRRKIFKGANGLRMVFRLPFGKEIKDKDNNKIGLSALDFQTLANAKEPISESSVSTSSYDMRQFHPKEPMLPPPKRQVTRQRNSKRDKIVHVSKRNGKISRPGERTSTSEDSDFLTLSNRLGGQNRNSSSGYVSCSECESESCIDRCYCSLKDDCKSKCYCSATELKKESPKTKLLAKSKSCKDCSKEYYDGDFSYCSCDSESCADSNKCYCVGPRRGVMQSSQSLEYLRSPSQRTYSERLKRYEEYDGRSSRTRSSATGHRRREERSRRARSSDSLALDYELLLQNKPRDTRSRNMQRLTVRSTGAGSHDALSVKKSAEMAALFADVRLSQRTDVRSLSGAHGRPRPAPPPLAAPPLPPALAPPPAPARAAPPLARMFDHRPLSRNASLEDTLGYLP